MGAEPGAHGSGYFTEATSADVVVARDARAEDARPAEATEIVTRHLHAAVEEIEPTQEEWMAAIRFPTRTGHACTDWRQEFILLSDVLGVSMLMDDIDNRKPQGASEGTVLGPFHVEDVPECELGADPCLDGKGEPMLVRGRVTDAEGVPLGGVTLDMWEANDEDFYDVQQQGLHPEFNLRGMLRTGADGRSWFRGVKPKYSPIPDDGPVGGLLKGLGRHPYRPAHLHYIAKADGHDPLVTHIFDPDIHSDAVFGVKESLLAEFRRVEDPAAIEEAGMEAPFWLVQHDFALAPAGAGGGGSARATTLGDRGSPA